MGLLNPCHMDTFLLAATMVWEQILNIKTSSSIANKGDHSMPTLRNPRHERFAQELATGKTADAAYVLAGYKENRSNAARLGADRDIQARVAEIQSWARSVLQSPWRPSSPKLKQRGARR